MSTRAAEQIADAVLYEGYVLYPYRASSAKNRYRWQVGVVVPREYAEAAASDPWFMQTECLASAAPGARLTLRVRGLHVQERAVERAGPSADSWERVDTLNVRGRQLVSWDEALVREFMPEPIPVDRTSREWSHDWRLEAGETIEPVVTADGQVAGRIVRRTRPVAIRVTVATEPGGPFVRIRVRVENVTPCTVNAIADRQDAARLSLAGTHAIISIKKGEFVSLLEPPAEAAAAAAACVNLHTWPVLVGRPPSRTVMLSSPIILYDYPSVAPESPGDLFDATEIDELLLLRVRTLTPDEKLEARATDERAARIVERADSATPEVMGRLHGATRHYADSPQDWERFLNPPDEPSPEAASIEVGGVTIARGLRVRLRPVHRADSLDLCLAGRTATVDAVHRTLEDKPYVTVILDDDPFGSAGSVYRRALFFHPDELVPLDHGADAAVRPQSEGAR